MGLELLKSIIFRELSLFGLSGRSLEIFLIWFILDLTSLRDQSVQTAFFQGAFVKNSQQQLLNIAAACGSDNSWGKQKTAKKKM